MPMVPPVAGWIRLGALGALVQVSTDDLTDLINDTIIALAVGLPVVAMVFIGVVYVVFLWEVSRWWRAAVVSGTVALAFLGLAALGGKALRDLGIAAMLDAVNTPMLATVTSLPLTAALLRGGLALGALAVVLGGLGFTMGNREPLDIDGLDLSPGERRTVRFAIKSLSPGGRTRDCTRFKSTSSEPADTVVLCVLHALGGDSDADTPNDLEVRAWLENGMRNYFFGDRDRHESLSTILETETRIDLPEDGFGHDGRRFCFELIRPESERSDNEDVAVELALELESIRSESSTSDSQSKNEPESPQDSGHSPAGDGMSRSVPE